MKLMVMAYTDELFETDIDMADIDSMIVEVVTGDEVVTVNLKDGTQKQIDADELSGYGRAEDYFDGSYGVHPEDFEKWMSRTSTYDQFHLLDAEDDD